METNIILSRERIRNNVLWREDHGNCSGDQRFVLLVDFLDHDDIVTAEGY